jgi:thiamine-phosphate pyrophosphorylase
VARTQLCLHWTVTGTTKSDETRFAAALDVAQFATVLIEGSEQNLLNAQAALPLIEYGQSKGVAALIAGDAQLARTCRADGVHLQWSKAPAAAYSEAREILGNRYIVGVDAGRSRHDAMQLGETGADYVGFGIPPHVEDLEKAVSRRFELASWWAEIFEVPVVALDVRSEADALQLTQARVDFIAIRLADGLTADATLDQIRRMAAAIAA